MKDVFFDSRWRGQHGIGRFACAVQKRLGLKELRIAGVPSSPVDPVRLLIAMSTLPKHAVVLSPGYNAPLFIVRPYVLTVHDLNHLDVTENSSFSKRLYYSLILKRACVAAKRVLTVSEFSRRRIIAWAGVLPDKVVNVGNGVDAAFQPNGPRYDLGYPYLLAVGNRKPHKNEARLVEAFSRARIDPSIRLVFTGDRSDELARRLDQSGVGHRSIFLGKVSDDRLASLYRGALALLFPSTYEGFGLPVIEAMACGTPVLTSRAASLGEVAGPAALIVDPMRVDDIAQGIERICNDPSLRCHLKLQGLQWARSFSWDRVAERVRAVLEEVVREICVKGR